MERGPSRLGPLLHWSALPMPAKKQDRLGSTLALVLAFLLMACDAESPTKKPSSDKKQSLAAAEGSDDMPLASENRPMMLEFLSRYDDGLPTSFGVWPDSHTEPALIESTS